jgi:hypothetical protein
MPSAQVQLSHTPRQLAIAGFDNEIAYFLLTVVAVAIRRAAGFLRGCLDC